MGLRERTVRMHWEDSVARAPLKVDEWQQPKTLLLVDDVDTMFGMNPKYCGLATRDPRRFWVRHVRCSRCSDM